MAIEILDGRRIRTGELVPTEAIAPGQLWTNGQADVRVLAVAGDGVRYADAAGQVHEASGRSFQCRFFQVLGPVLPSDAVPQAAQQAGPNRRRVDEADDEDGGAVVLGLCKGGV